MKQILARFAGELSYVLGPLRNGVTRLTTAWAGPTGVVLMILVGAASAQPNTTWQTPAAISGASDVSTLDNLDLAAPCPDDQLLALNEALEKFALKYPSQAELVKLRYFVGMTNEEVSQLLEISLSTVKNYWNFSRAWLFKEIEGR
jgi:hypothetical protein